MSPELIILIVGIAVIGFALFINKYAEPLDHDNHGSEHKHAQ